jgi:hypothetical protein
VISAFTYGIDELRTLKVKRNGTSLEAALETAATRRASRPSTARSPPACSAPVSDAGEEDLLAVDLAAIFEWDVDFNTELQKGDSFRLAVEKQYLDGAFSRYGSILAAELLRGDRVLRAVRFASEKGAEYFTPEGLPLRKTFLRSPLKFTRISSGFTPRAFHPVLEDRGRTSASTTRRPPARPCARPPTARSCCRAGRAATARPCASPRPRLETLYGHLSRIDVKRGQHVAAGRAHRRGRRDRPRDRPAPRLPHAARRRLREPADHPAAAGRAGPPRCAPRFEEARDPPDGAAARRAGPPRRPPVPRGVRAGQRRPRTRALRTTERTD